MGASRRPPRHRRHSSGQGTFQVGGRSYYTGVWGTPASDRRYLELMEVWARNGGSIPEPDEAGSAGELVTRWLAWAGTYYVRRSGGATSSTLAARAVAKDVRALHGATPVARFGPSAYKEVRDAWVARGLARRTVNAYGRWLVRAFRWGVEEELVPETVYRALAAVRPLQAGRSAAREGPPVGPVPEADALAAIGALRTAAHRALFRFLMLTGMRIGEAIRLRPSDVDRSGPTWTYRDREPKSAHLGVSRVVAIGPRAQEVLGPLLDASGGEDAPAFRNSGSDRPLCYESALGALARACKRAGVPIFRPHQLRHLALSKVEAAMGREAAQAVGGHTSPAMTARYTMTAAEAAALERAKAAASALG